MASPVAARLAGMPEELEQLLARFGDADRGFRPDDWGGCPGETFSAIEHACHLLDIERDGYQVRLRRVLDEDRPELVSLDGYALAVQRGYAQRDPTDVLRAFRDARLSTLRLIEGLDETRLARSGVFAEYGIVTVDALLHYLRSHDLQHLACLEWLLGKLASRGARG
jgi:hypothetical protein